MSNLLGERLRLDSGDDEGGGGGGGTGKGGRGFAPEGEEASNPPATKGP